MTAKCTVKYGSQKTHWNKLVKNACSAFWGRELKSGVHPRQDFGVEILGVSSMQFLPYHFGSLWKLEKETLQCCKCWIFINKSLLLMIIIIFINKSLLIMIIILVSCPLCIFFGSQPVDCKLVSNTHGKPQEWNKGIGSFMSAAEIFEVFLDTI